ncbi:elongation factor P [bacterium]|nr:elongation factor P [bacterium]
MLSVTAIRNGMTIKVDDEMYVVTDFAHVVRETRRGFIQTSLRSLRTGRVTKLRFRSTDSVQIITLEPRKVQFLYRDGEDLQFMDLEDYNTIAIPLGVVGDAAQYLAEGLELDAQFYEGKVVAIELRKQVKLKIVETAPGVKGDSVSSNTKPATLETGLVLQVPLFVKEGEVVEVDTRTGQYLGRG